MATRHCRVVLAACVLVWMAHLIPAQKATAATNLAVFNFQLKTGQDDWVWLEKFMSDQMATDLVQDRSLSVVARDRMQLIAQQMKWVPEFATTDAKVMGGIRSQLSIEYLVTGVCSVQGDQLEITGQIVEVQTRKEVHRKTVTGKTAQVIDLQKQLSSEVMAWLTKRPAGEILKTLPMWTRSIPAVRALYEGMHLYDQGRYAEGWLKFRDASREDKNYVEAIYWVGKMYYFMCRYEHARRTLEKFVYLDCFHPRTGDALAEYAHTLESTCASPGELLALYSAFGERFPNSDVWCGTMERGSTRKGSDWVKIKSNLLLQYMGRYREAAMMIGPATDNLGTTCPWAVNSMHLHHATTGQRIPDDKILWTQTGRIFTSGRAPVKSGCTSFAPGQSRAQYRLAQPVHIAGQGKDNPDREAIFCEGKLDFGFCLLAPSGFVFKSLRFEPVATGEEAVVSVSLGLLGMARAADGPLQASLRDARARGFVFNPAPRTGMLAAQCTFHAKDANSHAVRVDGMNISATLEEVGEHGTVDVQCMDTYNFRVEVDGAFGRWMPGLVGPLSPGEHSLTIRPTDPNSPYGDWSTKVNVNAGQVTPVLGRLPWKKFKDAHSIVTARVAGQYAGYDLKVSQTWSAPAIQADDKALRMVWSHGGDLWSAVSTDGNAFTAPRKLDQPVSSVWDERDPRLLRDESGRFVLTFVSDRDAQHRSLPYLCWSNDFVNWSAPAIIADRPSGAYDVAIGASGVLFCVIGPDLFSSRDGFQWNSLGPISKDTRTGEFTQVRLLPRDGGRLELYGVKEFDPHRTVRPPSRVFRFESDRGLAWSSGKVLAECVGDGFGPPILSATVANSRAAVFIGGRQRNNLTAPVRMLTEATPQWLSSGELRGFVPGPMSVLFHPRWGWVLASTSSTGQSTFSHDDCGPYMVRSPHLPELFQDAGIPVQPSVAAAPEPAVQRTAWVSKSGFIVVNALGYHTLAYQAAKQKSSTSSSLRNSQKPKPGDVTYISWQDNPQYKIVFHFGNRGAEHFTKARPGCGTVNPNAIVTILRNKGRTIAVAIDSLKASSANYDVLRLDLTGKCDFTDAAVVPATAIIHSPGTKEFETRFESMSAELRVNGKVVPGRVYAFYLEVASPELWLAVGIAGESKCMFGGKLRTVQIFDMNGSLTIGDPGNEKGRDEVIVYLDHGQSVAGTYGLPITIDGQLYDVTVSVDGSTVAAKPYTKPTGKLTINHPRWKALLKTAGSEYRLSGGPSPISVPPGRYTLAAYTEYSSADPNKPGYTLNWLGGSYAELPVEILPDKTIAIAVGSPTVADLRAEVSGRSVKFRYVLKDAAGQPVSCSLPPVAPGKGSPPRGARLRITDAEGRPVYGCETKWVNREMRADWSVRAGLSGTFTATAEYDRGPFTAKPATATFTVK